MNCPHSACSFSITTNQTTEIVKEEEEKKHRAKQMGCIKR